MSRTIKGSPYLGAIPKSYKKLQRSSQKMAEKENLRAMISNDAIAIIQFRKTNAWNWF